MKSFQQLVEEAYTTLVQEADAPPPGGMPAGDPNAGGPGESTSSTPSALPGMGQQPEEAEPKANPEVQNKTKREADPVAYTQETLTQLVDPAAGIS